MSRCIALRASLNEFLQKAKAHGSDGVLTCLRNCEQLLFDIEFFRQTAGAAGDMEVDVFGFRTPFPRVYPDILALEVTKLIPKTQSFDYNIFEKYRTNFCADLPYRYLAESEPSQLTSCAVAARLFDSSLRFSLYELGSRGQASSAPNRLEPCHKFLFCWCCSSSSTCSAMPQVSVEESHHVSHILVLQRLERESDVDVQRVRRPTGQLVAVATLLTMWHTHFLPNPRAPSERQRVQRLSGQHQLTQCRHHAELADQRTSNTRQTSTLMLASVRPAC